MTSTKFLHPSAMTVEQRRAANLDAHARLAAAMLKASPSKKNRDTAARNLKRIGALRAS